VSFATPFNLFGSKGAIMLALSTRRIALMHERLARASPPPTAVARVLAAVDIAAGVMLDAPAVNRAVMGAIGAPCDTPGDVLSRSGALWAEALGTGIGLAASTRSLALNVLPDQLAVGFRGVLSFWTAGELADRLLVFWVSPCATTVLGSWRFWSRDVVDLRTGLGQNMFSLSASLDWLLSRAKSSKIGVL
jgi:hypothetical protein